MDGTMEHTFERRTSMVIDRRDSTMGLCEGGVWFPVSAVADLLEMDEDEILEWVEDNLGYWNDHLMDAIVDFAIKETARVIESNR